MDTRFSFSSVKKAHLIGIKGAGMAALAEILVRRGVVVTGSDVEEVFFTDSLLRRLGVPYVEHFGPENIPDDADVVVYSTAYAPERNAELRAAMESDTLVLSYPEAVGLISREHLTLAVCGTHGKTTTSALLAEVLREAGTDPLALVGSRIRQWEGNALAGNGQYFVLEADEYQNKLQYYEPFAAILTSVDWDHPDFFPTVEAYEKVFADFLVRVPHQGYAVVCGDSASVERVAEGVRGTVVTYGFLPNNSYRIEGWRALPAVSGESLSSEFSRANAAKQSFEIVRQDGESLGTFELRLAGKHNALNAAAVVVLCEALKIDREKVRAGLSQFAGTERRFEYIGEASGVIVYDDYAHHPEEIRATLQAFRDLYPEKRLVTIFHPHTFTRTKALLQEFAQSFEHADRVLLLDIYGSAREEQGGVSSDDLVALINKYFPGWAENVHTIAEAAMRATAITEPGDILVTMGAGNVWEAGREFLK